MLGTSGLREVAPMRVPGEYEVLGADFQILNMVIPSGIGHVQVSDARMRTDSPTHQLY